MMERVALSAGRCGSECVEYSRVKQIVDDSNKDVSSAQNHMKYLKAVDKRIDHKLQKLGDQIRSNLITIEENQRWLHVSNAFLHDLECRRDMLDFMNAKEAFEKFKVELDDEYHLGMAIDEHDIRIDNYNYQMSELMNENKTLEKEMDDLNHLKQYISNVIQACKDEIIKISCTTQPRN